jgi:hypothetical protein
MLSIYLSFNRDKYINFAFILSLFSFTLTSIFLISYFYNLNLLNYIFLLISVLSLEFASLDIPSAINTITIKKPSILNSLMENNDNDRNSERPSSRDSERSSSRDSERSSSRNSERPLPQNSERPSASNNQPEPVRKLTESEMFTKYLNDQFPKFTNILKSNFIVMKTYPYHYNRMEFEIEYYKRGLIVDIIDKERYLSTLTILVQQGEALLGPKTPFLRDIRKIITEMGNDDTKSVKDMQRAIYTNSLQEFRYASLEINST